jgi:hypothetical protein
MNYMYGPAASKNLEHFQAITSRASLKSINEETYHSIFNEKLREYIFAARTQAVSQSML